MSRELASVEMVNVFSIHDMLWNQTHNLLKLSWFYNSLAVREKEMSHFCRVSRFSLLAPFFFYCGLLTCSHYPSCTFHLTASIALTTIFPSLFAFSPHFKLICFCSRVGGSGVCPHCPIGQPVTACGWWQKNGQQFYRKKHLSHPPPTSCNLWNIHCCLGNEIRRILFSWKVPWYLNDLCCEKCFISALLTVETDPVNKHVYYNHLFVLNQHLQLE